MTSVILLQTSQHYVKVLIYTLLVKAPMTSCFFWFYINIMILESLQAVVRRCSSKQVFLKISQISQETPTHAFSCEIYEIFENTFF